MDDTDSKSGYEVGYGKPPAAHRFQKGQSGMSNGVQKGPPIGVEEGPPFRII